MGRDQASDALGQSGEKVAKKWRKSGEKVAKKWRKNAAGNGSVFLP